MPRVCMEGCSFHSSSFLYVAYALYIELLNNDTVEIYINAHF